VAGGQDGVGSGVGVEWIGLSLAPALPPVRAIDLDDLDLLGEQVSARLAP